MTNCALYLILGQINASWNKGFSTQRKQLKTGPKLWRANF